MPTISPFSLVVLKNALPAVILLFFIFISLLFLIRYTEAFYLVIIAWIIFPIIFIQLFRWLRAKFGGKQEA
jgi:4-amino-4-deoxy-L-arabinose transferase-like glycosyltransferase